MNTIISRKLLVTAVVIACVPLALPAHADHRCADVNLQVTNQYRDPVTNALVDIKVVDFDYWDKEDNKWREESTDNKIVDPNQTGVWNKGLEYIGGESGVKVRAHYKYRQAGGNWSATHTALSSMFKCVDGMNVAILVN